MSLIQFKIQDRIGTIAFDDYQKRNALSADLIVEMIKALKRIEAEKAKVVILRSSSNNPVWSAGHDINELPRANQDPLPYNDPLEQVLRAIRHHSAPVIAMVHGSVWGGACDLAMNCDMIIADETCAFAVTPAKLGLPYNVSGIQSFLKRVPINIVREMFFTAEPIDSKRALNFGLVNRLVAQEELESTTYEIAKTICLRSAQSIMAFKEQARVLLASSALSPETFEHIEQLRKDVYHGRDYNEGVEAFLEKRKPVFR